jgi:hypothetical protein
MNMYNKHLKLINDSAVDNNTSDTNTFVEKFVYYFANHLPIGCPTSIKSG